MLAGDLKRAEFPAIFAPNQLVLRFPPGYNQQCANCSEPARQQRIHDAIRRITGETWTIRVEQRPEASPPGNGPPAIAASPATAIVDPLIGQLMSALDARLLKRDDGFGAPAAAPAAEPDEASWTGPEEE